MPKGTNVVTHVEMGKRLKETRENKLFTQEDIAGILHIGLKQYQRYEYGDSTLPYDSLIVLEDELNYDIHYIVTGKRQEIDVRREIDNLPILKKLQLILELNENMYMMMIRQIKRP